MITVAASLAEFSTHGHSRPISIFPLRTPVLFMYLPFSTYFRGTLLVPLARAVGTFRLKPITGPIFLASNYSECWPVKQQVDPVQEFLGEVFHCWAEPVLLNVTVSGCLGVNWSMEKTCLKIKLIHGKRCAGKMNGAWSFMTSLSR